jgi:hypothetical protein
MPLDRLRWMYRTLFDPAAVNLIKAMPVTQGGLVDVAIGAVE